MKTYLEFYGHKIEDAHSFKFLATTFLCQLKITEKTMAARKELQLKAKWENKEEDYKKIVGSPKAYSGEISTCKQKGRKRFIFSNRIVTPLLIAGEKKLILKDSSSRPVHKLSLGSSSVTLQESLDSITINEDPTKHKTVRKQGKSHSVKRSYMEMQNLTPNNTEVQSILSIEALKALFAYIDFECLRFTKADYIIVGDFAAVVFEVIV